MTNQKIAIIGAGKIAHSLTSAVIKSGYDVELVISRDLSSAKALAKKFSIPHYSNTFHKIPDKVDVFFLTVPDGEIKKVAEKLSRLKRDFRKSICIHFSGVENISALSSLKKKDCAIGSLHIVRPFPSRNIVDISNSPASIETKDKKVKEFIIRLCKKLRLRPHIIDSDEKVLHHLAAVYSSNFMVGNLFNAFSFISRKSNLPKDILRKTSQSALDNVFKLSPAKALSGPIDRGDIYTIKKHIDEFDLRINKSNDNRLKLLRKNYIIQSLSLLEVVKAKYGKLSKSHKEIEKFLKSKIS